MLCNHLNLSTRPSILKIVYFISLISSLDILIVPIFIVLNFSSIPDRDQYKTSLLLNTDTLDALRQSKRLVENKFQAAVETIESQTRDIEKLTIAKITLEDELTQKSASLEALQNEFVSFGREKIDKNKIV